MADNVKLDKKERKSSIPGQAQVIMDISPDGSVEIVVDGVAGSKCEEITKEIIKELGDIVVSEKTDDYYKKQPITKKPSIGINQG